jgi:hypothetical protein
MKITKILVALSFLFAVSTANAGEMTVTGNMETTYITNNDGNTGNPLGMDKELKFAGSTELDNGITVSVMQDTNDSLTFGNSQISFGNVMGLATIYVGSDHDPMDSVDDITPSAYEEANGSGSGTYTSNDIGDLAGQMGIGTKIDIPGLGNVNAKYYPKADGTKNNDNAASAAANANKGSGLSIVTKTNLGDVSEGIFDGATLTLGYEEVENSLVTDTRDQNGYTGALTYATGPVSLGVQKKYHYEGQGLATATAAADEALFVDTILGVAYAVNDNLSVSVNRYTSKKRSNNPTRPVFGEQESTAFNIGYTIGGMTIGLQDASTDNSGYTVGSNDDTRTLGISVSF